MEALQRRRLKRRAFARWQRAPHWIALAPTALSNSPAKLRHEILRLRALAHDINAKVGQLEHLARHQNRPVQTPPLQLQAQRQLQRSGSPLQSRSAPSKGSKVPSEVQSAYTGLKDYPNFTPTTLFNVTEDWRGRCFEEGNNYLLYNYTQR